MAREAIPEHPTLSAQEVADAFVQQYYNILCACPENSHKFYKEDSIMARPGSEGTMISVTTGQVGSLMCKLCTPKTIMGSVIVGVTGSLVEKDNAKRIFAQTFLLAPQETGGFFVHNDFLRFLDVNEPTATLSIPEDGANSLTAILPKDSVLSSKDSGHEHDDVPNSVQEIISNSDPTPKEAFEILKKGRTTSSPQKNTANCVSKPVLHAQEDINKISYASILANSPPFPTLVRAVPPGQQNVVSNAGEMITGARKYGIQYKRSYNGGGNNRGWPGRGGYRNDYSRAHSFEGRGDRNDGEARGPNWRNSTEEHAPGGSSTATKRNGGLTIE